ncbi:MAG: glycosyltransferase family 2 protein, partial [Pseudomonadota bacterium]
MTEVILITTFVLSAFLVCYHHVAYPILLAWYSKNTPNHSVESASRGYKPDNQDKQCLSVTILVPAYNEQL